MFLLKRRRNVVRPDCGQQLPRRRRSVDAQTSLSARLPAAFPALRLQAPGESAAGARPEPADCHSWRMSNDGGTSLDLTRACWGCQYWAGLIERVHAKCSRANASLQASPATGCAHWVPGAGDSLPTNCNPIDCQVPECVALGARRCLSTNPWRCRSMSARRIVLTPSCSTKSLRQAPGRRQTR
jgi:hypothetical protein